jgi:hypothetical protein
MQVLLAIHTKAGATKGKFVTTADVVMTVWLAKGRSTRRWASLVVRVRAMQRRVVEETLKWVRSKLGSKTDLAIQTDCRLSARHSHSKSVFFHHRRSRSNPSLIKKICPDPTSRIIDHPRYPLDPQQLLLCPPAPLAPVTSGLTSTHDTHILDSSLAR